MAKESFRNLLRKPRSSAPLRPVRDLYSNDPAWGRDLNATNAIITRRPLVQILRFADGEEKQTVMSFIYNAMDEVKLIAHNLRED
ncbi:hypothetical protein IEQ34_018796 [Dendrobium chrysotoxum]|uniref:Uncharacterized protein n=1 Tax=Dendrobium chrysotoxum TaxID=161865 RepID=A0AAV7G5J8_DENCH|nr:hypothetical protein IEQ34_018796 [Dendrobium chrysotoxum]